MNKKVLRKLMLLNNPAVIKKLEEIATGIKKEIETAKNNDIIYERLELINEFIYSIPDTAFAICKFIINNPKPNNPKTLGSLKVYGKTHKDLVLKCAELIGDIRYYKTEQSLEILAELTESEEKEISQKSRDVITSIAKYNYHALKNTGLKAQSITIDFAEKNYRKVNLEVIKNILTALLSPSFEGSEMKNPDTFSWVSGTLVVSDELKDIRNRAIKLIFKAFTDEKNIKSKVSILQIIDTALRFPHSSKYGEDFEDMIAENANGIIDDFYKIVFDEKGKIIASLPVVAEIESQLNWMVRRPVEKAKKNAKNFIELLNKDELYITYRLLAVSMRDYKNEMDYKTAKEERKKEIEKVLNKIGATNIQKYRDMFEEIGNSLDRKDYWEWQELSGLLIRIASEKPQLAQELLKSKTLLSTFFEEFMAGFRKSKNWPLWDQYYKEALKKKDIQLIVQLFSSFFPANGTVELVRQEDVEILANAIEGKGELKDFNIPGLKNRQLHNAIMLSVATVYNFDPKGIESLISKEIKLNPEIADSIISNIELGIIREQINLDNWEETSIDQILEYTTVVNDLDYDLQSLMKTIAQRYPDKIMDIFSKRIELEIKDRKKRKPFEINQYEAIPYHFDEDLARILSDNPNYHTKIQSLVKKMINPQNVTYNWNASELIKKIGGQEYQKIITDLIASKDETNLKIALELLRSFEKPNMELIFRIIKNCSGPKSSVWKPASAQFFNSGVVSGEYGLRDYYQGVLQEVEKVKEAEKENDNIQLFTKDLIVSLKDYIERETKRVEEEKIVRKIEFES